YDAVPYHDHDGWQSEPPVTTLDEWGTPWPLTPRYNPRLEGEGAEALTSVPAHALKQATQVRDLTTVRYVVPGHLPQGGSHGARLGHRRDDALYFQVRIAQGGQVGTGSLFDRLVVAHLDIFRGWIPLRHLGSAPPHPAVVGIRVHAKLGGPAVPEPHLRLRL